MKILRFTFSFLGIAILFLASCGPGKKTGEQMPSDSLKMAVSKSLDAYAGNLMMNFPDTSKIKEILQTYLDINPSVFGSAVALEPIIQGSDTLRQSLYLFRGPTGYELKNFGKIYDYSKDKWYSVPVSQKKACWSEPYFDAPGGNVKMITYSVPMYKPDGTLIGVITADLEIKE